MSFYEKGEKGELVPVKEDVPEEAIQLMDRMDDEAIIHRLTSGIASEAFIYRYPIQTKAGVKEIIGISADGADEIAHQRRNIEVLLDVRVDKESDPDYYYAMVRAKDLIANVTLLGVGRQCKYQIGKGNLPDHERMDEHAFVKSITKAQRNVILHLTPETIIIGILNEWSKTGKSRQLRPPPLETEPERARPGVATPSTLTAPPTAAPPAAAAVAEQVEKLKKLRMLVHNRFQTDLGVGLEKRKAMLKQRFGVDSLTELNEQQLNECNAWVEEMIKQGTVATYTKPVTTTAPSSKDSIAKELGFEGADEQNNLKGRLYVMLTDSDKLNIKPEEAKRFIVDRGFESAVNIPKARILELIREVDELIKIKQAPPPTEGESDEIPF